MPALHLGSDRVRLGPSVIIVASGLRWPKDGPLNFSQFLDSTPQKMRTVNYLVLASPNEISIMLIMHRYLKFFDSPSLRLYAHTPFSFLNIFRRLWISEAVWYIRSEQTDAYASAVLRSQSSVLHLPFSVGSRTPVWFEVSTDMTMWWTSHLVRRPITSDHLTKRNIAERLVSPEMLLASSCFSEEVIGEVEAQLDACKGRCSMKQDA